MSTPTITNFLVPAKTFGVDGSFNITDPSSNSAGAFTYTSSNASVATISGKTVRIIGGGISTITANQAASGGFLSGYATYIFYVNCVNNTGMIPQYIDAGIYTTAAGQTIMQMSNTEVYCCGYNLNGQLGDGTLINRNTLVRMILPTGKTVKSTAVGSAHTLVLFDDNTLYGCGYNSSGQLTSIPSGTSKLTAMTLPIGKTPSMISVGYNRSLALMTDGSIYACGYNNVGQLGNGTIDTSSVFIPVTNNTTQTPQSIVSGNGHTMVLMANGDLYGFGNNQSGQLGDGTILNRSTMVKITIPSGKTIDKIYCGAAFTIILMTDQTLWVCGANSSGQLGNGTTNNINILSSLTLPVGKTLKSIKPGYDHTLILMTDNTIYACGGNNNGQFGNGTLTNSSTFTQMLNNTGKIPDKIYAGYYDTIVIMSDGTTYSCGNNTFGQLGIGTNTRSSTLVQMFLPSTITNFSIPTKTFGDASFNILDPSSNSTGAFTYTSSNTAVADVLRNTVTIVGAGTSTITASQATTTTYSSGSVTTTLTVNKITTSITGFSIPTKTFGDASFNITNPTSNSTGAFTYTSSRDEVATISGKTITIVGSGTSTITATQVASGSYLSGSITTTLTVNKAVPSITNFSVPTKTIGAVPFYIIDPSSTSDGGFSYVSSNLSIASINGKTITINGLGTCDVTLTQAETANYNSKTIYTTFTVNASSASNPTPLQNSADLSYFLTTNASYAYITSDISVDFDLIANTSQKILVASGGTVTIRRSGNQG